MRLVSRLLRVFAVGMLSIVGCNEVTTPPDTVEVQLLVKDNFEHTALEDAEVCQTESEPPNCVTTNANASATLQLPANQELSITVEKEGYGSILYPVVTGVHGTSFNLASNMFTDAWLADNLANLQSVYPPRDTGIILVIITPRFAGATFELVNATGKAYYKDEDDNWSLLEATTSGGSGRERATAEGGFVEVGEGVFQVEIGGTAQGCALTNSGGTLRGWPGNDKTTIRVPVRTGFETRVLLNCPLPP